MKRFKFLCTFLPVLIFLIFFIAVAPAQAVANSFVSVVNPIRGQDFWDSPEQVTDTTFGEMALLKEFNIPATWLVRLDAFQNPGIINLLKSVPQNHEIGLFLEVTPTWADKAGIPYQKSSNWHSAGSVFLTGYKPEERKKLIDTAFSEFKKIFGFYPKSVGAWWVDSYSLDYMQEKYGVSGSLIVADQYTTDNYQIWGQYWSSPYYPAKKNTLRPAQSMDEKLPVVVMQWAPRDPVNGYGKGVEDSTYSVQANDYMDYHNLDANYFSKLLDAFLKQPLNQTNQIVAGLENSYSWQKYKEEYKKQIEILADKRSKGEFSVVTMDKFSNYYKAKFTSLSPEQIIVANDPLNTNKKTVWFMNLYYRAGWFFNKDGSVLRDVRQYTQGQEEPCYKTSCSSLNFATFSTRVLDDVTYGQKLILDAGKIKDFNVEYSGGEYVLGYQNESSRRRQIKFMPRDISIDDKVYSIDSLILEATNNQINKQQNSINNNSNQTSGFQLISDYGLKSIKFLLFVLLVLFIPGFLLVRFLDKQSQFENIFLSISTGMIILTLVSYLGGFLKMPWLIYLYPVLGVLIFFIKRIYREINLKIKMSITSLLFVILVLAGTFFQSLSMVRSGWNYNFGIGFWGPTGHDGIWHLALANQLLQQVPPQNPAFAGQILVNYHYFYDLLVAASFRLSQVPLLDLIFRFYPLFFSLFLGLGTYLLIQKLINNKFVSFISLYFVYFSGSFGWVVEYLREKHFGGESAFWVNQPVSANLNPPFAISLLILIGIILMIGTLKNKKNIIASILLILFAGSLIEFKAYAGIIVLGGMFMVGLQNILYKRSFIYFKIFLGSLLLSLLVFLPQNSKSADLLIFAPFWFVHSMVDFPDRVGWLKLSQGRQAYFARGEWLKYILTEVLGLLIFIVGNLGVRFIALFTVIVFIKKKLFKVDEYSFIFWLSTLSILIPIIFIQKGNPWNTIQFTYYFLYLVALFSGVVFWWLFKKLPKIVNIPIIILLLFITPINAFVTFTSGFYENPPSRLTVGEQDGLTFLKSLSAGAVLTVPFDRSLRSQSKDPFPLVAYETTAYVSAFSGKSTFMEDEIQQEILQTDFKKRLVEENDFFNGKDKNWSREFLSKNSIRYIYVPKISGVSLDIEGLNIKNIYNNNEVAIFEVLN